MSEFECLHDKAVIEEFLRRDTDLHLYELGDLDDFFWPQTQWYGRRGNDGRLAALALLYVYSGNTQPTLLAFGKGPATTDLVRSLVGVLPPWFYGHLSPGVAEALKGKYQIDTHGSHQKMSLKKPAVARAWPDSGAVRLGPENLAEVLQLYAESYPGNWFDPRMLETREYFGIRERSRLVSIAGVHVFSPALRVAALGNITTLPTHRKKGLATRATRDLCRSLLEKVDHIGLNVAADNRTAISCYRKLGFEVVAPYQELAAHLIP
ncbi:MAG: GNAT family N-acetyltransferase [Candidatus Riflebacteria bacterium]|nr:GNAT family N-acetyltransferase [Candidatus Riflebacteria bacterium]